MSEREASQLGTLWEGDEEAGREHVTSSYKSPHSRELGVSEQGKESLFQQNMEVSHIPEAHPIASLSRVFPVPRESRTGLSCSLQQPSPTPAWQADAL